MSKELFVTDMDGTLLGTDSRVSARSAEIISRLSRKGMLITVATARTPATVDVLLKDTYLSVPAIVMTGAAEWDTVGRRFTRVSYMGEETGNYVDEFVRSYGIVPMRYAVGEDGIVDTYYSGGVPTVAERKFLDERSGLPLKRVHVNDGDLPADVGARTVMFFAMGDLERIMDVGAKLRADGRVSVSAYGDIFDSRLGFLEVFAPGVSKASAIKKMAERLGVERITVFGDNLNDLPMMEIASTAVAVANGKPDVREMADMVIGANSEDSVAIYLESRLNGL